MNPFKRPDALRIASSSTALTLLAAVIIFILLLISSASQLARATAPVTVQGPLGLFELQKIAAPGGYTASISLLPGSIAYFIFWALAASAIAWLRLSLRPEGKE
jgi:type IV secretory pathway protease TraF